MGATFGRHSLFWILFGWSLFLSSNVCIGLPQDVYEKGENFIMSKTKKKLGTKVKKKMTTLCHELNVDLWPIGNLHVCRNTSVQRF